MNIMKRKGLHFEPVGFFKVITFNFRGKQNPKDTTHQEHYGLDQKSCNAIYTIHCFFFFPFVLSQNEKETFFQRLCM